MAVRFDHDLAIIGGGSAGLTAAKVARFFAKRTVLVDKERLGGCLNYGCVPSKALIKAARVAHEVRTAHRWGLDLGGVEVSLGKVNGRVHHAISRIEQLDSAEALAAMGVDVRLGGARFLDEHTLQIGDSTLTAKFVLVCTGSRPAVPAVPGLTEAGCLTNEDVFDLQHLPRRLAVLGGGPIGIELAQAFQRLGSQVTVLQRGDRILPKDDAEVVALVAGALAEDGLDVRLRTTLEKVVAHNGEKVLTLGGEGDGELVVDAVLVAVGRSPNVEGLGLDRIGVAHSARGIEVDEQLRTSVPHVYACGDVLPGPQFTHWAGYQAAHAVRNLVVPIKAKFAPGHLPWVTFCDPELAHVGLTEEEAVAQGRAHAVVRFPYDRVERAVTDADPVGLMKILIDDKRRIVGCHIAGANSGELVNEVTLAMNHDLTVDAIIASIHAYPTYGFGLPVALYEYALNEDPSGAARLGRFLSRLT